MLGCLKLPVESKQSQRRKLEVDQEAVFIAGAPENVEKELAAAIGAELAVGVESSLACTRADLAWDDLEQEEDRANAVKQTMSELTEFARPGVSSAAILSRAPTIASEDMEDIEEVEDDAGGATPEHLAQAVYEEHGLNYSEMQGLATKFLQSLRLRPHEVGSRNFSRWRGRTLWNQCFYLSMAFAYLGNNASIRRVRGLARRMRRAIEAVVLDRHPSWAAGLHASTSGTGKAMVFADFLPLAMRSEEIPTEKNFLAKFVVCIMDSVNGHVEVYFGPGYNNLQERSEKARNLLVLWYTPAHYQALVRDDNAGSKLDFTYDEFKQLLREHGVQFIETLE